MQENSMKKLLCWKLKKKSIRFSYHASYEWNIAEQYFGRIRIIALYMHISGALWPTHRMKFIQFRCGNLQQFGTKLKSKSNVFSCFLRIPCASWIILASKFEAKNWKKKTIWNWYSGKMVVPKHNLQNPNRNNKMLYNFVVGQTVIAFAKECFPMLSLAHFVGRVR